MQRKEIRILCYVQKLQSWFWLAYMSSFFFSVICTWYFVGTITGRYQVELTGWPSHVTFKSPSQITTSMDLWAVWDVLKSGICRWTPLSHEANEELAKCVDSGELRKKSCAPQADKGKKRGPRNGVGKENRPPQSVRRTVTGAILPHSTEFVGEDED